MTAVLRVSHVVVIAVIFVLQSGQHTADARIANGCGRQARGGVGVVGADRQQILCREGPLFAQGVEYRENDEVCSTNSVHGSEEEYCR